MGQWRGRPDRPDRHARPPAATRRGRSSDIALAMNSDRALPALEHGTATSRLQLAEDVVERGCRQLDIMPAHRYDLNHPGLSGREVDRAAGRLREPLAIRGSATAYADRGGPPCWTRRSPPGGKKIFSEKQPHAQ
jgi:hypothetical protein